MAQAGWTPRAAGWFTRSLSSEHLAVVAASMASSYGLAGEGQGYAHLGLRVHAVEEAVSALCQVKDGGYKQRTTVIGLGYASPAATWVEWPVSSGTAADVAAEMTAMATNYGVQHVKRLAADADALALELVYFGDVTGVVRKVVVLALAGRVQEASEALRRALDGLDERTYHATAHVHRVAPQVNEWLAKYGGADSRCR